jgi:hypothetical protein
MFQIYVAAEDRRQQQKTEESRQKTAAAAEDSSSSRGQQQRSSSSSSRGVPVPGSKAGLSTGSRSQQQLSGAEGLQEVKAPGQVQAGPVQSRLITGTCLPGYLPGPGPCIGAVVWGNRGVQGRDVAESGHDRSEICDRYARQVTISVITQLICE